MSQPNQSSLLEYKQAVKYWAKPDEIKLADTKETLPMNDPFKSLERLPEKKPESFSKITQQEAPQLPERDTTNRKQPPAFPLKFSVENPINNPKSIYEDNPDIRPSVVRKETEPLYSSFNPKNVFTDAQSAR